MLYWPLHRGRALDCGHSRRASRCIVVVLLLYILHELLKRHFGLA